MMMKWGRFVNVTRGFYEGFHGIVFDRRCFLWYRIDMGDVTPWIFRWNLTAFSHTPASKKFRESRIERKQKMELDEALQLFGEKFSVVHDEDFVAVLRNVMDRTRGEGFEDGIEEGYDNGWEAGHEHGYDEALGEIEG